MMTTRILLVDDHPVMRRGLSETFGDIEGMAICGEAASAAEALELAESLRPDVALVDVSMGDDSGIELVKLLKEKYPNLKTLVLSMHDEMLFAERAIRAGSLGYLNKSQPTETLIEAIRLVARGKVYLTPKMTDRILHQMAKGKAEPGHDPVSDLSDRELQVFEMIGQGFITKQIAGKLNLSAKTIETHREHIKEKLNLANATELTRRAVQWVLQG
jgi:DNA-binding NarL/FixJ family response regulator